MLIRLELQEIGRFASLNHKAPQFGAFSLIFARNGYGKSTVSAVVRSAAERQPDYISSRRKLDAKGPCLVRSTWSTGPVDFNGATWTGQPSRVFVFDQEFVQQNVHVGDSVTRENKRRLLPVVLGEEGVKLAAEVVRLDQAQREAAASLKEQATRIKEQHPSIDNVSNYCSVTIPPDINSRVASAARAVELAKQTVAVREKAPPKKVLLKPLADFRAIAASTIATISGDVAAKVRAQIERHGLAAAGDRWIKFGVDHLRDDICPFCNQSTSGIEIVTAYQAYYGEAFAKIVADRDEAVASVKALRGGADANWRVTLDANATDYEFWRSVTEVPEPPKLSTDERDLVDLGLALLEEMLAAKTGNPLSVLNLDSRVDVMFELVGSYNDGVDQCAVSIESAKQSVRFADLRTAQTTHLKLIALQARQSEPMLSLTAQFLKDENKRDQLAAQKEHAQRQLTTYAPATISARQASINSFLSNFGTDFKIVDAKANFVGREPNTDFAIAIGSGKLAVGDKSETKPSFKTVLSAGDKTTLALAFFLAQVRADPALKDAVVVFDDPFNSQDMNRQFETTSQIRAIAGQAMQVIVMSHDPRFLHMIEKDARTQTIEMQLQCSTEGEGRISLWSSAEELKDLYVRNSEIIREYGGHGSFLKGGSEVTVLQAIRPFLEDYIRARFPSRFGELDMLDRMIAEIEAAGPVDPLFQHAADLRTLNEYTRPNMHGGGQPPDPNALRAQCRRVIDIVGTY